MTEDLKKRAMTALSNAYSPYSGIKVAAAVLAEGGAVYTGVNIENASYGLTVCAERNAVMNAVGDGAGKLLEMAVVTDSPAVKSPCGSCRQVLLEFAPDLEIGFYGPDGYERHFLAKDLLPEGFSL